MSVVFNIPAPIMVIGNKIASRFHLDQIIKIVATVVAPKRNCVEPMNEIAWLCCVRVALMWVGGQPEADLVDLFTLGAFVVVTIGEPKTRSEIGYPRVSAPH